MNKKEKIDKTVLEEQEASTTTMEEQSATDINDAINEDALNPAEQLLKENEALKQEIEALQDKYKRIYSDFDNFKKRSSKQLLELRETAASATMSALLPVLDDFDRAKKSAEDENSEEYFSEGVELVYHKLYSILEANGLAIMDSNGKDFDPELHEAVTEVPAPSEELKGKVIDTTEKGYFLKNKIIRYARVIVGK